ncbi:MAG: heavy-metal-associated domain-containing protein [Caldicoprobacterales bacterium]|jgi:copper chaperone|nr:heavy-metal-associated domain-containing protein [Clostridia bacterium]MDI9513144.1 heavy-metal-associated domain-containing protein [Bacillota bacterium]NLH58619.1 heavy-metal-associated domain-containing protein [Clostridiales bacterium]
MKKANIQLEPLVCPSCSQKIEGALKALDGVDKDSIKVLFNSSKVKLNFDDSKLSGKDLEDAITKMGYEVLKLKVN